MSDEYERSKLMDAIAEPFPVELLQTKRGMTYVETEYYRDKLNAATGGAYDWEFVSIDFRLDGAVKPVGIKDGTETIVEWREPVVCQYIGKLTIPGLGSRVGIGVQEIQVGGGADSAYKGAESDAFKRACMAFGMGLKQLYIDTNKHEQDKARREAYEAKQAEQKPRETPISPKEYGERVKKALTERNGAEYAACVALAGTDVRRWSILIANATDTAALEWVKGKIPHRMLDNSMIIEEIRQRERALAAAADPKPIADKEQATPQPDKSPLPDADVRPVESTARPASEGQKYQIRNLARSIGKTDEQVDALLTTVDTMDDAKDLIVSLTRQIPDVATP